MDTTFSTPFIRCYVYDKTSGVEYKVNLQAVPNAGDVISIAQEGESKFRHFEVSFVEHLFEESNASGWPARVLIHAQESKKGFSLAKVTGI
jgi:hypothetical protein